MNDMPIEHGISLRRIDQSTQSFAEVTELLDAAPGALRCWIQRFGDFLENPSTESNSRFTSADVETLSIVRSLLAEGNTYEQITHRLNALQSANRAEDGTGAGQDVSLSP